MNNQTASYRECFMTAAGQRVLGNILIEAGYFDCDLSTPEEIAVQNFAKKILKNLGIHGLSSVDSYINKLFELPSEM